MKQPRARKQQPPRRLDRDRLADVRGGRYLQQEDYDAPFVSWYPDVDPDNGRA